MTNNYSQLKLEIMAECRKYKAAAIDSRKIQWLANETILKLEKWLRYELTMTATEE